MPRHINSAFRVLRVLHRAQKSKVVEAPPRTGTNDPYGPGGVGTTGSGYGSGTGGIGSTGSGLGGNGSTGAGSASGTGGGPSPPPRLLDGWADVFGIKEQDQTALAFAVSEKLGLLYREIMVAERAMLATGINPELYEEAFCDARRAVAPTNLTGDWKAHQSILKAETLKTLAFCVELLPNEERLLEGEELDRVWERLEELKKEIDSSELPDEARAFIREQITIIEEALDGYEITGARAFRHALVDASLSYSEHESAVVAHEDAPEIKRLGGIWSSLTKLNERSEVVQKLLGSGVRISKLIGDAADQISKVI
jgi:hypothetical protein